MTGSVATSVRARLSNKARQSGRPFQELLQYYGLERFLCRLSRSRYASRFLLGHGQNDIDALETMVRAVSTVDIADDGLAFDAQSIVGERIKEGADYEGVRIKFTGYLEKARIPMQIDIAFGDVVHPCAEEKGYPTLLGDPAPRLRMYPRETVIAEKFEALVYLGSLNSRMKDFFDIWLLASQFDFVGVELARAIGKTFKNRGTDLDPEPVALTPAFTASENTQKQWAGFIRRSRLEDAPARLEDIREPLRQFLLPVAVALTESRDFIAQWTAPGPWRDL